MTKDETSVQPQVEVEEVEDDNTGAEGDNWGDAGGWDDDADWGDMDVSVGDIMLYTLLVV